MAYQRAKTLRISIIMVAILATFGLITTLLPVKTSAATLQCDDQHFSRGESGACVERLQHMLNTVNKAGLKPDGKFGKQTKAAVIAWQKKQKATNKKMLVDGIAGPQTWGTLCAHKAEYQDLASRAGCNTPAPQTKKKTSNSNAANKSCVERTFSTRTNRSDTCVGYIQFMLNLGAGAGIKMDDKFGSDTKRAVTGFQSLKKIKADGAVGKTTWNKLCTHKLASTAQQDVYNEWARMAGCKL